jgi:hypothetical protein
MLFTHPNTHYIFNSIRQVQYDFTKFASYMLTEALDAIFDAILISTKKMTLASTSLAQVLQ